MTPGRRPDLRLYAVLDPARCRGREPVALAVEAVRGGATMVQLRDKASDTRKLVALASGLKAALAGTGVPLVVNDRVDVALAAGADGVHLGIHDMDPADARRLLGPGAIIGATVHHPEEADALDPAVADYVGLGPVFATASKDPRDPPLEPDGLGRLLAAVRHRLPETPTCAIAGIDAGNAASALAAGIDGIAVISAIFMAVDVLAAAGSLRALVDAAPARGEAR